MTRCGRNVVCGSSYNTIIVIARRERSERRGNPSACDGRVRIVRFAYWFTVDRHGLRPRDDKMWGNGSVRFGYNTIIVIARRNEVSDAAIHRDLEEGERVVCSLTGSQWIATGFQPSR